MALIQVDFTNVEDEYHPIAAAIYDAVIEEEPTIEQNKTNEGKSVHINHKIITEGPENGKVIRGFISLKQQTLLKRLGLSAGLHPGPEGLDLAELVGKAVKIKIIHKNKKDQEGNETIQANILDWIIPLTKAVAKVNPDGLA